METQLIQSIVSNGHNLENFVVMFLAFFTVIGIVFGQVAFIYGIIIDFLGIEDQGQPIYNSPPVEIIIECEEHTTGDDTLDMMWEGQVGFDNQAMEVNVDCFRVFDDLMSYTDVSPVINPAEYDVYTYEDMDTILVMKGHFSQEEMMMFTDASFVLRQRWEDIWDNWALTFNIPSYTMEIIEEDKMETVVEHSMSLIEEIEDTIGNPDYADAFFSYGYNGDRW